MKWVEFSRAEYMLLLLACREHKLLCAFITLPLLATWSDMVSTAFVEYKEVVTVDFFEVS